MSQRAQPRDLSRKIGKVRSSWESPDGTHESSGEDYLMRRVLLPPGGGAHRAGVVGPWGTPM